MRIAVIGLGYVGLPVAIEFARQFETRGFDIDEGRIGELLGGFDRTGEVPADELGKSRIAFTSDPQAIRGCDIYIITVPTPIDSDNRPDLGAVLAATRTVGAALDPALRPTIVYESTVYPGVTDEVCGPLLESLGFIRGKDFRLGYSPERVNPGDREHRIDRITKVIAGEDEEVTDQLETIYGAITSGGVFRASSIKAAEAAKAIENAQRDINIAFVNEVAQIVERIGVSVWDVLEAARTKWNFLPFEPGLVGGHCIGVDPFYLSHLAEVKGVEPQVVLAGRTRNDTMSGWIAERIHDARDRVPGTVLVLGATFKENIPDVRNSRIFDLIERLEQLGHQVQVSDPLANADEVFSHYRRTLSAPAPADVVIGAVRHAELVAMHGPMLDELVNPGGLVADLRNMWRPLSLRPDIRRWSM